MYTLDTNIIIYLLDGDIGVRDYLAEQIIASTIFVSTITEIELFAFPNLDVEGEKAIDALLARYLLIPVDSRIARIAASLRRKRRQLSLADSVIAATALATQSILVTRNVKDFQKIDGLTIEKI